MNPTMPTGPEHNPLAIMSFGDHLEELRLRLMWGLAGVVPIFILSLVFGTQLLAAIIAPAEQALQRAGQSGALQVTSPMEAFGAYIQIAVIATIALGSPWLLYQAWRFVAPGLYTHERRFVHLLLPLSALLVLTALSFMYFVILPVVLAFFISFTASIGQVQDGPPLPPTEGLVLPTYPVLEADPLNPPVGAMWYNETTKMLRICTGYENEGDARTPVIGWVRVTGGPAGPIKSEFKVKDYVSTVLNLALAFTLGFQMPAIVLLLGWVGIVERVWLIKYRKWAVLACTVAGAVLTPADPLSMLLLAGPLYLLFELGLLLLRIFPASKLATPVQEETDAGRGGFGS